MRALLLTFISLFVFNTDIYAQEKNSKSFFKSILNKDNTEDIDSIKHVADSLQQELVRLDSIVKHHAQTIDSIERNTKHDSLQFMILAKHQSDSLLNVISNKEKEIISLKANIGFVDTCMVKLANRWLYERFDKVETEEAIKYFDRIYSSKLKSDMSIVQELLHSYERSYREFQSIIKEAQHDIDRENPFVWEEYKNKYKNKIENMSYYIKYYKSDWNIRYLNKQITEALKIIQNHSSNKFADFTSLIDPNF